MSGSALVSVVHNLFCLLWLRAFGYGICPYVETAVEPDILVGCPYHHPEFACLYHTAVVAVNENQVIGLDGKGHRLRLSGLQVDALKSAKVFLVSGGRTYYIVDVELYHLVAGHASRVGHLAGYVYTSGLCLYAVVPPSSATCR